VLSPGIIQKAVYSGTHATSFAAAASDLAHLAEVDVGAKQIERLTHRIGADLLAETRAEIKDYQALSLMEKGQSPLPHPPSLAVVMMDGGRYQRRSDAPPDAAADEPSMEEEPSVTDKSSHWREDKIGLLMTMSSAVHEADPHPEIPEVFVDRKAVEKLVREVGHVSLGSSAAAGSGDSGEQAAAAGAVPASRLADPEAADADYQPPTPLVRTMVATAEPIAWFSKLLTHAAWARGFAQAARKAFVADGASANWNTWKNCFSDYTPILDFIHALSYVYLAASVVQRARQAVWETYTRWIRWLWSGNVAEVIAALEEHQRVLGVPAPDEAETTPRSRLAKALTYLQNHQSQMRYDEYRKAGLPLTSCHVESTVKRFNRRVKGTEKFWSAEGAEDLLTLKAAYLGETGTMDAYWQKKFFAQPPPTTSALAA
jgi:hypothetical protein